MIELMKCIGCKYKEQDLQFGDNPLICPPEDRTEDPCCNTCKFDKIPYYSKERCMIECVGMSKYVEAVKDVF